jgi:hypothetical protein
LVINFFTPTNGFGITHSCLNNSFFLLAMFSEI